MVKPISNLLNYLGSQIVPYKNGEKGTFLAFTDGTKNKYGLIKTLLHVDKVLEKPKKLAFFSEYRVTSLEAINEGLNFVEVTIEPVVQQELPDFEE